MSSVTTRLLSLLAVLLLISISEGQQEMTGITAATYPDGSPFASPIYHTAYDPDRGLLYGAGLAGELYTFNSTTLVHKSTTNLKALTSGSYIFSSLNIPVGLQIKTGNNPRLMICYTYSPGYTSIPNYQNLLPHTLMLDASSMSFISGLVIGTTTLIPSPEDQTSFDLANGTYLHFFLLPAAGTIRVYAYKIGADTFDPTRKATPEPICGNMGLNGVRYVLPLMRPYYGNGRLIHYDFYDSDSYVGFLQYTKNTFNNDIQIQANTPLPAIPTAIVFNNVERTLNNPPPYNNGSFESSYLAPYSLDNMRIKDFVFGPTTSSIYALFRIGTFPSKGCILVQIPPSELIETNTDATPKSLTHFRTQTTFNTIGIDEGAYPANNTRVMFFGTTTGNFYKYRFRDNGGSSSLDFDTVPYTTQNVIARGISFTYQTTLLSEKRILIWSKEEAPNDLSKLYSVPFADCGSKTTCESCIAMNDPYCGWCVLDGKCSYNSSCSTASLTNGWLKTSGTNSCPSISNYVTQDPISVGKASSHSFVAVTMPPSPPLPYSCVFTRGNGNTIIVNSTGTFPNLICPLSSITAPLYNSSFEFFSLSLVYDPSNKNVKFGTFSNAITIFNCGYATNCDSCQSLTFACGWCTFDNKCSISSSCQGYSQGKYGWLDQNECPEANYTSPALVDVSFPRFIYSQNGASSTLASIMISGKYLLNYPTDDVTCNFKREGGSIDTTLIEFERFRLFNYSGVALEVYCKLPNYDPETTITIGDRETISVSLTSTNVLVPYSNSTTFTIYKCSTKTSCESCLTQDFTCKWSNLDNKCYSPYDIGLTGQVSEAGKCPVISSSPFKYIGENYAEVLTIQGKNLPDASALLVNLDYTCVFSNSKTSIATRVDENTLTCPSPLVSVDTGVINNVTVTVTYGDYNISQESTIRVSYVDCGFYGESCLTCREASSSFGNICGWCTTGASYCSIQSNCTAEWSFNDCPAPTIDSITPESGPIQGGTKIIISGKNLGLSSQEIEFIKIGATGFCREITWLNSNTLRCLTDTVAFPQDGKVTVSISGQPSVVESGKLFTYVQPEITSVTPGKGQVDGGTSVTFNGKNLDIGSAFNIDFGGQKCRNLTVSSSAINCITPLVDQKEGVVVSVIISIDDAQLSTTFEYTANPTINSVLPKASHAGGKANITITGTNLDLVPNPVVKIGGLEAKIISSSLTTNRIDSSISKRAIQSITVELPEITETILPDEPISIPVQIFFGSYFIRSESNFVAYANPTVTGFSPSGMLVSDIQQVFVEGSDLLRGGIPKITVAGVDCVPNNRSNNNLLKCDLNQEQVPTASGVPGKVIMEVNSIRITSDQDFLFSEPPQEGNKLVGPIVGGLAGFFLLLLLIGIIIYFLKMKKNKKKTQMLFAELDQANDQNMKVLSEVMEAYTEYNTRDKTFSNPLFGAAAISFTSFESYAIETLFPKDESVSPPAIIGFSSKSKEFKLVTDFKQLLLNENFTNIFLKTMERQSDFKVIDRKYTAAILMISLHSNMDYATKLLFHLMRDYISEKVKSGESKTILRATSTITEKYLTAWLAFSLFSFIQEHLSKQLLNTYASIKGQIEKGAVDYLTGSSQYTINASSILRQKVNYERIKIKIGYLDKAPVELEVNTCDCISQVINAALFVFEGNTKNSLTVGLYDSAGKALSDADATNELDGEWTKYNTLEHYQVKAGDEFKLMKKNEEKIESTAKYFHLEKKVEGAAEQKVAPSEVFFTRMMTMREVIHQHVDALFESVFSSKEAPPVPVKLLFDFLDTAARDLGVNDPDTIHIWKNNSLALRFWVNLITNPNQLFDITKTVPVHNSLSTVGQVLMDSCSTSELKLGQGAPASKLLYKNEVEEYKKLVSKYYEHVRQGHLPSNPHIPVPPASGERLDENSALYELRKYANKYSEQIKEALPTELRAQFEQNINN